MALIFQQLGACIRRLRGSRRNPASAKETLAPSPKHERGVALLMTLGVLALLLILAMSFAYNARTERMASAVNADMIRARLLCESGLERAMAYLGKTFDYQATLGSAPADAPRCLFPATDTVHPLFFAGPAGGDWAGRYYVVSMQSTRDQILLESALAVNLGFDFTPTWQYQRNTQQLHDNRSWQPIKAPEPFTDTNGNGSWDSGEPFTDMNNNLTYDDYLVGRIAFLIVDESGKIDPNGVITPDHEPYFESDGFSGFGSFEHYFDVNGDGTWDNYPGVGPVPEGNEVRSGGSPEEINGGGAFVGIIATNLASNLPGAARHWFSWRHLRKGLTGMTDAIAKESVKAAFPFSYDIEAYSVLEGAPAVSVDKHRFDLARTGLNAAHPDWDAVTVAEIKGAAVNYWTDATRTAVAPNTSGLPWLTSLVAADGSTSVTDQVCANLKDYGDTDSIATTVNYVPAAGTWVGGARTLASADAVGLEKVPYINEIAITAALTNDGTNSTFSITVNVELINMYNTPTPVGENLTVDLAFAGIPAATPNSATVSPAGATLTWPVPIVAENNYGTCTTTLTYTWPDAKPIPTPVSGFNVTAISATLTDGSGKLLDLARIGAATARDIAIAGFAYGDVEVVDPRCNTSGTGGATGNWQWSGASFSNLAVASSVGRKNNVSDASSPGTDSKDAETLADPAGDPVAKVGLSTAYIRNVPMKSLWELGCIHRGEPWRTLRLAKYNASSPLVYTYANGDANILEQVKLGPYLTQEGRFNANSPQPVAWRTAIQGIRVGAQGTTAPNTHGYDAPGIGGTALNDAAADNIVGPATTAGTILYTNGTGMDASSTPGTNRGAIARAVKLSDGSCGVAQDTDRKKEEIIGKLANLLTVRQNYFTVVVTAQAIKDLGTLNIAQPGVVQWNDGGTPKYCRVLAEQKIMAIVYRDAFTNKFRIDRFEYLDE